MCVRGGGGGEPNGAIYIVLGSENGDKSTRRYMVYKIRTQRGRIEQPDWSVGGKQNHLVIPQVTT